MRNKHHENKISIQHEYNIRATHECFLDRLAMFCVLCDEDYWDSARAGRRATFPGKKCNAENIYHSRATISKHLPFSGILLHVNNVTTASRTNPKRSILPMKGLKGGGPEH